MRIFKNVITAFLCLILSVNLIGESFIHSYAAEESFTGTRHVEFSIDKSDLSNYIDGGRAVFDLILRGNTPDWLNYEISSDNRDVFFNFRFEFISYDDYCDKLSELLTYSPSVGYSIREEILLLENYSAIELLNFLQSILISRNCLNEKSLDELFEINTNEISINSTIYQLNDRITIYAEDDVPIKFDMLKIDTTSNDDGSFVRKIIVNLNPENFDVKNTVLSRFENVGKSDINDISNEKLEISVEFNADNQNELIRKTMLCLRASSSITEKQSFLNEKMVSVERYEFFDLENLLNENGEFSYSHIYPSYVSNITEDYREVHVSGLRVSAENVAEIVCGYERSIQFSEIEVLTDLSDFWGKMKRTIFFSIPTEIASEYHEVIKQELQTRLTRGSTLDIYDSGSKRIYEVSFSSFFSDEVLEFSKSILNTQRAMKYSNSWIPLGRSRVSERIEVGNVISDVVPPNEIVFTYDLPAFSFVLSEELENDNVRMEKASITFLTKSKDNINFEFRSLNVLKLVIELVPVIVTIVIVLISKKKKNLKYMEEKNNGKILWELWK